jgi:hypothetical protein
MSKHNNTASKKVSKSASGLLKSLNFIQITVYSPAMILLLLVDVLEIIQLMDDLFITDGLWP